MAINRVMKILYQILVIADNILLLKSESEALLVAISSINTYTPADLSVLEISHVISSIQCSLRCLDLQQCMAIKYGKDSDQCRLYGDEKKHVTDPVKKQTFRAIGCLSGWTTFSNSCYQLNEVKLTWFDAMEACEARSGYLVEIESASENNFIYQLLTETMSGETYWIGGTDEETEGDWIWAKSTIQWFTRIGLQVNPIIMTLEEFLSIGRPYHYR